MSPRRSEPLRSCVQCGAKREKRTLLRMAGRAGQGYEPDLAGRRPGRGLYLCRTRECVEGFLKRIGSAKGRARWGMGPADPALAGRLGALIMEDDHS